MLPYHYLLKRHEYNLEFILPLLQERNMWETDIISFNLFRKETRRFKPLSRDAEKYIIKRIEIGDEMMIWDLVLPNISSLISIAKKYQNHGITLNDLVSEGIFGIIAAAKKFDSSNFNRFYSYCVYYIRGFITRAINKYAIIYIPDNTVKLNYKISQVENEFILLLGEKPYEYYLSEIFQYDENKIAEIQQYNYSFLSLEGLKELFFYEEVEEIIHSNIVSEVQIEYNGAESALEQEDLHISIETVLKSLPDREQEIIKMAYGIGCPEYKLDEIGEKFSLTRERVRQIKEKTIKKLKGKRSFFLRQFLG